MDRLTKTSRISICRACQVYGSGGKTRLPIPHTCGINEVHSIGNIDNTKDWTEDFTDENGNYICRCIQCQETFTGHKRRVICKECDIASNELRERIADMQHRIWTHWMRYFYTQCIPNPDGTFTIPVEKTEHWRRQMTTDYCDLTEKEKDSDRSQADKILKVL